MIHADVEPDLGCPGWLRPDRFGMLPDGRVRAWRCQACKQRFVRCLITGRVLPGSAVDPATQLRLIQEAQPMSEISHIDFWRALAREFEPDQVRSRTQAGRKMVYITARTVMNRLDEVLGPGGWWDEFVPFEHSVICRLTIRLPDGSTITKTDAGGHAGMQDAGDDDKSAFSDSFKRAAVKFGIGRYLYNDGVPDWVARRRPEEKRGAQAPAPATAPAKPAQKADRQWTGAEWKAWVTKRDETEWFAALGKDLGFPADLARWNAAQIARAQQEYKKARAAV